MVDSPTIDRRLVMSAKNWIVDELFDEAIRTPKVAAGKIVAAVVRRFEIVAKGNNSYKTHPFQKKYGKNSDAICLHAETNAVIKALKTIDVDELAKCDIYIARAKRESIGGKYIMGLAKPCDGCQRMITSFGIKNVYFTTDNGTVDYL